MRHRHHPALILTLCLCLLPAVAGAQGFNAVFSRDGQDVWAVGTGGTVYRSMDKGATWSNGSLGSVGLNGVAARNHTVLVVADGGTIYRSTDAGGTWASQVQGGSPDLVAVVMTTDLVGYIAGAGGLILKTEDGGVTWSPQTTGTTARLNALSFLDANTGYAAGAGGTILKTEDGGAVWTILTSGTTRDLLDIAAQGSTVWAVGKRETAVMSTDGGMNFTTKNLKMESYGDVRSVSISSLGYVTLAGGGGFIRRTTDGGLTWTFQVHKMYAPITDLYYVNDSTAFFANSANRCVMSSTGTTWNLPTSTIPTQAWQLRLSAAGSTVRGDALHQNGQNPRTLYVVLGVKVYKSPDYGETWVQIGTITGGGSKTNSFYVHPADSMVMVAAVGSTDRISRSTDGGTTWTTTISKNFTEYGMPLEMNPDDPNRLFFMPEDGKVYESRDFGATWNEFSSPGFRSPCDIIVVPDDTMRVFVGDGVTGSGTGEVWRSLDGGRTFQLRFSGGGSEIPMMGLSRMNNATLIATQWSGGGVEITKDAGNTWPAYHGASSAWGCDFAGDDPNVAIHGQYSGGNSYLTNDLGAAFTSIPLSGANYAFAVPDRATFIAQQGGGVYKLLNTYPVTTNNAQNLIVQIPNGGNTANAGQNFQIRWFAQNVALARIEYQTSAAGPWIHIADVDGYAGQYDWLVPNTPTTDAKVRIIDLWDNAPIDESNAPFTIVGSPALTLNAPGGGESWQYNTSHDIEWSSLLVSDVAIEYRTSEAGPWVAIESTWPAATMPYSWLVPNAPTSEARIRVRDLSGTPADSSGLFSIIVPQLAGLPDTLDVGMVEANTTGSTVLRLDNTGTAPLSISDITLDNPLFRVSRTAFVIAVADTDTVTVYFEPTVTGVETANMSIASDDPASPGDLVVKGEGTAFVGVAEGAPRPAAFALRQNRPNPFTGTTRIEYAIPASGHVRLDVFDMSGRLVAALVDQVQEPGEYSVDFGPAARTINGRLGELPSGVYFYRLQAGSFRQTQRMLLVR